MYFYQIDCDNFREWIVLNLDGITWQKRFEKEFNDFWAIFFMDGLSIKQLMKRYSYAIEHLKTGPLQSWMNWLKEKNLCYFFIYKNISLYQLAKEANITVSELANLLRDFFCERFPQHESFLIERFHIGSITSEHLNITYGQIERELALTSNYKGSFEDDIMTSLEVTLFSEWEKFLQRMKKDFFHFGAEINSKGEGESVAPYFHFLKDVLLLSLLGGASIFSVNKTNQWFEERLSKKIRLFEPDFLWTDKSLAFKNKELNHKKLEMEMKEMEKLNNLRTMEDTFEREERFEEETDVILTSLETLPQDIQKAGTEQSLYEEKLKGGYRDEQLGSKKVYRVMMKSSDINMTRERINQLLQKYGVVQANTVRPGLSVPGGIYYNLFVPMNSFLEFLSQVGQVEESSIFVSKTSKGGPPGKTKVFIWIKEI